MRRVPVMVAVLVLVSAIGLRLGDLGRRSLWYDEAWAALECIDGQFGFADSNTMPVAYCGLVRVAAHALGRSEASARLPAAIGGIGATLLAFAAGRHMLSIGAATLAAAIVGLLPIPVYFGKELKPYGVELCLAAATVVIAGGLRRRNTAGGWVALLVLLAIGAGLSFAMPVMVAGAFVALLPSVRERPMRYLTAAVIASLVTAAWALSVYLPQEEVQTRTRQYWHLFYLDVGAPLTMLRDTARSAGEAATFGLGMATPQTADKVLRSASLPGWATAVVMAAMGLGALHLVRGGHTWFVVLAGAWHAALIAAAFLHRYPYGPARVALFLLVPTSLLLAAAVDGLLGAIPPRWRQWGWLLAAAPLLFPLAGTWRENVSAPFEREELRPVLNAVRERALPTDAVWVSKGADFAFKFYAPDPGPPVHRGPPGLSLPEFQASILAAARAGGGRVWTIFSHFGPPAEEAARAALRGKATVRDEIRRTGAAALLWQLQ